MTSLSLSPPMPGLGYAMSAREALMKSISLDTDERDGIISTGAKSFVNTAIRCSSYSLPYITYLPFLTYISSSSFIYWSQYVNLGMGVGKTAYSGFSYLQGSIQNNTDKKLLAKQMFKEAILHGVFAYVDSKMLDLGSKVIIPAITTYVGIGALTDLFGKSKKIHNNFFAPSKDIRIDNEESDENVINGEVDEDISESEEEGSESRGYYYPVSPGGDNDDGTEVPYLSNAKPRRVRFDGDSDSEIETDESSLEGLNLYCIEGIDDLPIVEEAAEGNPRRLTQTLRSMVGSVFSPESRLSRMLSPITPFRKARIPGKQKMNAEVRRLLEEAEGFVNNNKRERGHRRISVGSK